VRQSLLYVFALSFTLTSCGLKDVGFIRTTDKSSSGGTQEATLESRAVFTQTTSSVSMSAGNSVTYGGACEPGATIKISVSSQGASARKVETVNCTTGTWSATVTESTDLRRDYQFTQNAPNGKVSTLGAVWWRDTAGPSITAGSLRANDGATSATNNRLRIALTATDSLTNVSHFCLRYSSNGSVPAPTDGCWVAVDNPDQPALVPARTLTLTNYFFRIGYTPNTYALYAYAKDDAGNISSPRTISIDYAPAPPPVIINVVAANTNTPSSPVAQVERTLTAGSTLYIKWHASSSVTGLASSPISLYYTTDEVTFTPIATGLGNVAGSGCTVDGVTYSGCYKWTNGAPVSTYFRVRVAATDLNGMVTFGSSTFINSNSLVSIAGSTDAGLNSSGTAALFFSASPGDTGDQTYSDAGSFVVTRDGTVYFRDANRGLLRVAPDTGIQTVLIPTDPTKVGADLGDGGPVASAYLRSPVRIALDYTDGLLVYDYDRIRRIDLVNSTIQTILGGGNSTADGVAPLSVEIEPATERLSKNIQMPFIPLPNGDLIFQSDQFARNGGRFRYYSASTGRVTSISPTGTGTATDPLEDIVGCSTVVAGSTVLCTLTDLTASFDTVSGTLTAMHVGVIHRLAGSQAKPFANLVPTGGSRGSTQTPHPPNSYGAYSQRITGRDGKIYSLDRASGQIHQFDAVGNTWTRLIGTGTVGACPDGTLGTSCNIHVKDFFADAQGNYYFVDRGKIRTLDEDGKVLTLYGQGYAFGDGGAATSARFGDVTGIDRTTAGEIIAADYMEFRFRSFTLGGNISTIAGTGSDGNTSYVTPATSNPVDFQASGARWDAFRVNPANGDIYHHRGLDVIRLSRATGLWSPLATAVSPNYPPNVIGINGTQLLVSTQKYDYTVARLTDVFQKLVALADGAITVFGGFSNLSAPPSTFCADGTSLDACQMPNAHAQTETHATYDAVNGVWLEGLRNNRGVRSLTPGGTLETLTTTDVPLRSFAHVRPASDPTQQIIYYCGYSDGRLYKRIVGGAETALPWDASTVQCSGRALLYDSARDSLYFVYEQNHLLGIAEYRL